MSTIPQQTVDGWVIAVDNGKVWLGKPRGWWTEEEAKAIDVLVDRPHSLKPGYELLSQMTQTPQGIGVARGVFPLLAYEELDSVPLSDRASLFLCADLSQKHRDELAKLVSNCDAMRDEMRLATNTGLSTARGQVVLR